MKVVKIDHLGIAVKNMAQANAFWESVLGLVSCGCENIDEQKVNVTIFPVGESRVECLESTSPDGAIAKHIEKRGEGLHHIALEVSDIQSALKALKEKGVPLVDEQPRTGVENSKIAFLHPKGTKALLEIVEPRE